MFHTLARFTIRHKYIVIAFWLVAAVALAVFAPKLSEVGVTNESDFLPAEAPSLTAQEVLQEHFPDQAGGGQLLIVLYDPQGLSQADRDYGRDLVDWLKSSDSPDPEIRITSVYDQPELEPLLVSADGQAMLILTDPSAEPYSDAANRIVERIREHIRSTRPQGLTVALTGQTAIGHDLLHEILHSVDKTTWATIILVIVVLLLVYRSPVAAGVPLVTIGTAYLVTRGLLGYLAQAGMKISSMMDAFIVVLIFGVGTDYALFLISRYREEVARRPDHDRLAADRETIVKIGPVITASAATVIIGTLGMMVARFQMTRTQGPAMAIGIAVALLASLTMTPALLSALGAHLFWPFHREIRDKQTEHRSPFWEKVAQVSTARPGLSAALVTLLLLIPYIFLPQMTRSFDILGELPKSVEARQGFEIITDHFNQGELMPVTVVLTDGENLQTPEGLARIAAVHRALAQVEGVDKVRSVVHPTAGEDADLEKALLAREQVHTLAQALQDNLTTLNLADLAQGSGDPTEALQPIADYLDELAAAFPDIKDDPAYTEARQALEDLQTQMTSALEQLQVHTQLTLLADQLGRMNPTGPGTQPQGSEQGLEILQGYLDELAQAYPEVRQDPGYQQAEEALQTLAQAQQMAQQMSQVSGQLGFFAAQMQTFAQSLQNPQALLTPSQEGQLGPGDQLGLLAGYLQELAQAYPEVQTQPAYADALQRLQALNVAFAQMAQAQAAGTPPDPQQMQQVVAQMQAQVQGLAQDLQTLAAAFADRDAPFVSQTLMQSPLVQQQQQALQQALADLQAGLKALAQSFADRDARLMPKSLLPLMSQGGQNPVDALQAQAKGLSEALDRLADALPADAYFLPQALLEQQPKAGKLLDTFLSKDRTAAQIQVLVAGDPYSDQALESIHRIRQVAAQAAQAQGLKAYVAGPSVQVADIRDTVDQDFPRVMAVVTVGVLLVFVVLLGSLVAPIYLVATVLLSYGSTMGLATLIFQDLLGHPGVNYAIPVVIYSLLIALGADYNIFLTSRVWEEAEKRGDVREGVRAASAYTGGVITSAGIILAGTFGALMVSSLQSLFQIGAAIALGVLLDTFIVRSALVPAVAALVGRLNWWPAKHPIGHGGLLRLLAELVRR